MYNSQKTHEAILDSARKEFMNCGFQNSSMRKIAENAKVTTGAMYNHFKNKDMIFEELVKDVSDGLYELFLREHKNCDSLHKYNNNDSFNAMSQSTDKVLDYIYDNFETMKLIVCYSQGSSYEDYIEKLIAIEEKYTKKMLIKSNFNIEEKDNFFIHIMSFSGMMNMFEAVRHNLSRDQAVFYMERLKSFYYAGWNEVLTNN